MYYYLLKAQLFANHIPGILIEAISAYCTPLVPVQYLNASRERTRSIHQPELCQKMIHMMTSSHGHRWFETPSRSLWRQWNSFIWSMSYLFDIQTCISVSLCAYYVCIHLYRVTGYWKNICLSTQWNVMHMKLNKYSLQHCLNRKAVVSPVC